MIAPVRALFGALGTAEPPGMPQTLQPAEKKKASVKNAEPAAPAV
ncbi:hypothetical protein [Ralstonia sp. 24A2]